MTEDDNLLYLCAFRYALGRRTYVSRAISEKIASVLDQLSASDLELISREITDAEKFPGGLGDRCDAVVWISLRSKIEKELDTRKHF